MPVDFHTLIIPKNNSVLFQELYQLSMNWKTPIIAVSLYLAAVNIWVTRLDKNKTSYTAAAFPKKSSSLASKKNSNLTTFLILLHNIALAVYSGITFYKVVTGMHRALHRDKPMLIKACDLDQYFWENTLGYWGYLFYLSKYYEFIDTFIILSKGRKPSFLQEYHHSGALLAMWTGIHSQARCAWIFVGFNSLIHALMYSYYAATTLGFHPPGKKYLTSLQITQFIVGMIAGIIIYLTPGCAASSELLVIKFALSYTIPLTYLFFNFARRTYGQHEQKVEGKKSL